jgi:hypothetical protein
MVGWLTQQIGKPYKVAAGRFGPDYYDCSGLVVAAYKQIGITGLGTDTYSQVNYGQEIGVGQLQIGDLVFTDGSQPPNGHVQVYIGGGMVIQAASTKLGVIKSPLNQANITHIRRVISTDGTPIQSSGGTVQGKADPSLVAGNSQNPGGDVGPLVTPDSATMSGGIYANPDLVKRPTTPEEVNQYIKDNYGYMFGFIRDPDLGPILEQAARERLSKDMLYGRISGTKWWKTHNDAQRKWQQITNEDPATAANMRAQKRASMANQLGMLGVSMSSQQLDQIVEMSLSSGMTPDQETDTLLSYATPGDNGYTQGDLGATQQQIQQLQSQYMIVRQNGFKDVADLAKRIASGELSMDGVRAIYANQAKSLFANNKDMIDAINSGASPYDMLTNQRNAMANVLEVDPDQIDMVNNPQYRKAIDMVDDKGQHRIMSVSEAEQLARDQPGYKNTVGGRRTFTQGSDFIAQYAGIK